MRGWTTRFIVLLLFATCACGASFQVGPDGSFAMPKAADTYSTDPQPNGVVGGDLARDLESRMLQKLRQRGDEGAEADGALAAVAIWILQELQAGRPVNPWLLEKAFRRSGFAGQPLSYVVYSVGDPNGDRLLDEAFNVPRNQRITRYGVATGRGGRDVAAVLGGIEASLDDFPRAVAPGGTLRLAGKTSVRFGRASVFVTRPDGSVRELPMPTRTIDARVRFDRPGAYKVEVMGYGAEGPRVLVNVPIFVGVAEDRATVVEPTANLQALTPEAAEQRLFELLNQARRQAGLATVLSDSELRSLALSHSVDMRDNKFVAHVSPTTGSTADRMRRAGLRLTRAGECLSKGPTPDMAHAALLDSPSHRAAMLDPWFSHVGIGVSVDPTNQELFVTLEFGRRPAPEEARQSTASVIESIQAQRKARGLQPVRLEPVLGAAASAGLSAALASNPPSTGRAFAAADAVVQADTTQTRRIRHTCSAFAVMLERAQLANEPLIFHPRVAAMGVASGTVEAATGPTLAVYLMFEGAAGQPLECGKMVSR